MMMMKTSLIKSTTRGLLVARNNHFASLVNASNNSGRFSFHTFKTLPQQTTTTTSSHDDFKPKSKLTDQEIIDQKLDEYQKEIDKEVNENPIFLYMKGSPSAPECGFSRAVSTVLNQYGYEYKTDNMNANVLKKEALKKYSDWPTIPQLFVKGELVGGCDIVVGLHRDGELDQVLKESGAKKVQAN